MGRCKTKEDPCSQDRFKILKTILPTIATWPKVHRCNFSNRIIHMPNTTSNKITSSSWRTLIRIIINSTVAKIQTQGESIWLDQWTQIKTALPSSQGQLQKIWCQCRLELQTGRILIMSTTIQLTDIEIEITTLIKISQQHRAPRSNSLEEETILMPRMEELAVHTMTISSISSIKMSLNKIQVSISVEAIIWEWATTV